MCVGWMWIKSGLVESGLNVGGLDLDLIWLC